jgi:hypothetical protein
VIRPAAGRGGLGAGLALWVGLIAAGCSGPPPSVPTATVSPQPSVVSSPSPTTAPSRTTPAEPTSTNTLPPPPPPTGPAPSSAAGLTAASLPVPAGWRTVALAGSEEEGFEGNGTWVHARDPRYAAYDVVGVGCRPVTRDDYTDPVAALEGNYESRAGAPGIGLVLEFGDVADANRFFELYRQQVRACIGAAGSVRTTIVSETDGLVDRRTYPDSEWTEITRQSGSRITLIILTDPGHRISRAAAQAILDQIA